MGGLTRAHLEHKSSLQSLKYLTEMDNWKLDNFYLTWDCTFCLRTFPDKVFCLAPLWPCGCNLVTIVCF